MIKITVIVPLYNNQELINQCLDSIELRDDVEIIVIDDCSIDKSYKVAKLWKARQQFENCTIIRNRVNMGVGNVVNQGYNLAKGQYVVTLCDDDYFIEPLSRIIPELDGTDLVYYNLRVNDYSIWELNEKTKRYYAGATKFIRKEFLGDLRRSEKRLGGDWDFHMNLLKKNPTEKFTNMPFYHYNFPREGSLIAQMHKQKGAKEMEQSKIRLAGITYDSIVDGPGLRLTIFTQGCPHQCKGCHNPETWDTEGGELYEVMDIINIMAENRTVYNGITFSGGEPLLWTGQLEVIARYAKSIGWDVWCYTGFLAENVISHNTKDFFKYVDVLVDGPFVLNKKSYECKWRGSTNQRLINVQNTLQQGGIVLHDKN